MQQKYLGFGKLQTIKKIELFSLIFTILPNPTEWLRQQTC